ncbi:MAG: hypothetical protein IPK64_15895 [bacterium]|nr:hypothetical protein [bacterium]
MAEAARSRGLQTIFSFFLGLMLTAFIGVGVYTFHPPAKDLDRRIQELDRREQALRSGAPDDELSAADRDEVRKLTDSRNELYDAAQARREAWGRSTSIILIALATLVMAVSLVRADQLPVISNGLLLGGVFTMVYGVGWIVATDTSVSRFIVMTVALAITLGLGYARFVRRRSSPSLPIGSALQESEGMARLEQRLRDVEERLDKAAAALGPGGDR